MYNVGQEYLNVYKSGVFIGKNITGTMKLISGEIISLDNSLFSYDKLSIDNSCSNSSDITFGSVYAGQLTMNIFGEYNRYNINNANEGAIIELQYNFANETIPLGVFNVYECTKQGKNITIKAYDNITKLNKNLGSDNFNGEAYNIVQYICNKCDVELENTAEELLEFTNSTQVCNVSSEYFSTYQDVLAEICELMCCIAYADRNGKIKLKEIDIESCFEFTPDLRTAITAADYDVFYTCLSETTVDNVNYTAICGDGTGLTYDIDNKFIKGSNIIIHKLLDNMMNKIKLIKYTPCEIKLPFNPIFDLGDMITIKADGKYLKQDINIIITSYIYNFNNSSTIKSVGSNRFLSTSSISNSNSSFSSSYNNLKNNGTYISTYENIDSYDIGTEKTEIAYLEMETGPSDCATISGQCCVEVSTPGTVKIIYSKNGVGDSFSPEQYLNAGKNIINFNTWLELTDNEKNSVNYYQIFLQSNDLVGSVQSDNVRAFILSSARSEGKFDTNNDFVEIIENKDFFNQNTILWDTNTHTINNEESDTNETEI